MRGTARLSADWIPDQVESGATAPLTDSGYTGLGDHGALHAVLEQAARREGAIAVLPVHARWVAEDRAALLRAVAGYGVSVALAVEDGPPYRPVPLPSLSAGAEALGALAYGAGWAAIAVREALRHLHPEPYETRGGWRRA